MDEYVSKSAVQQMLHEAYADDALSTKDGCKALYKRLDDMPVTDVQPVDRWIDAQKNPPPIVDRRSMTSESVLILRDNGECEAAYLVYDNDDGFY